jgi:hypothetical protein
VAPISKRRNSINHQSSSSHLRQRSLVTGSRTHSHLTRHVTYRFMEMGNDYSGGLQNLKSPSPHERPGAWAGSVVPIGSPVLCLLARRSQNKGRPASSATEFTLAGL